MPPSKKIIVCCDGTWNDSDGGSPTQVPTNVTKIARCLNPTGTATDSQGNSTGVTIPQIVYYQSGIGSKSAGPIEAAFDGFTGRGIEENVQQAYAFICNNYQKDDEVYLIGFSRGAYTVRVISALINDVGLLTKHTLGYFHDIWISWQMKNIAAKNNLGGAAHANFADIKQKLLKQDGFTQNIRIKVCAVFDTVGSLGIPASDNILGLPQAPRDYLGDALRALRINWIPQTAKGTEAFSFVDTVISPNIDFGFQALGLDEHRAHFDPTIWEDPDSTALGLKQCWFVGCHSHIGGGESDNQALPEITLAWMINKLSPFLSIDPSIVNTTNVDAPLKAILDELHVKGEAVAKGEYLTDSKKGLYTLDGSNVRTPTQYRTHRIDPVTGKQVNGLLKNTNETIHKSVRVRYWDKTGLLRDGKKYQALALKGNCGPGGAHPWAWITTNRSWIAEKVTEIPEEEFTESERSILRGWSNSKQDHLEDFDLEDATK